MYRIIVVQLFRLATIDGQLPTHSFCSCYICMLKYKAPFETRLVSGITSVDTNEITTQSGPFAPPPRKNTVDQYEFCYSI